ncbi:amidase [Roseomonas xinghualingensis]|uniref:amidase n=1 Tax=Roseomonas xinghualingensis TaxID=2986475 RepID=UPI0021F1868F|nr:amidase family protein [Roseomonas sp. SXEYE001]MCV4206669.1 amidase family protein [Roseomonas sp. SXEYE001]
MPNDDLLFLTAAQAGALIRRRALSPVEYVDAVLAAAERAQPRLNAFVTLLPEQARAAARAAEQAVMDGVPLGPLHGIPVSIKDQVDTAGIRTTHGSAIFADNIPARDDIIVTRLREAGAILVGKTRMPEFGHKALTDGPGFGVTPNPWDLSRTSGGSSGGAAAAVAMGLGPIAVGTDGAGSIRIPAACCGVVGLKPTLGAVPWEAASDAFGNYTYAGPISRSVTDAAVMLGVMAGPSPRDPWSMNGPSVTALSPRLIGGDLSGLRVGYIAQASNPRLDREMEANTRASLDALAALGAEVEPVTEVIDWIEFPGRIMYQGNFAVAMAKHLAEWRDSMDPVLLAFMERGEGFSLAQFRQAQFARTGLFRAIQGLLERYDVLVSPTLTRTALPAGFDAAHDEVEVEGKKSGITRQGWSAYVYPFNLTGHPALTVPSGFASDGLPTGVQIVGRWGADLDLLRLGAVLEAARPWSGRRPPGV